MKAIRGSAVDSFLSCRKRFWYEYVEGIEAVKQSKPLYFGTLMHKWLDALYTTGTRGHADITAGTFVGETDLSEMDQVELMEILDLFNGVKDAYHHYWKTQDLLRKTLYTEIKFRIPFWGSEIHNWYEGTIDHIFTDVSTGLTWLEDYKTTDSIEKYLNTIEYNRQISRYLYAVDRLSEGFGEVWDAMDEEWIPANALKWRLNFPKPAGMIFNIISKKVAKPPRVLQKSKLPGSLSLDKSQRTTYALYLEAVNNACPEGFIVPQEYIEFLEFLRVQETPQGNQFFRRVPVLRSEIEKKEAFNVVIRVEEEASKLENGLYPHRSEGQQCSWCSYKTLCYAERAGENSEMIRETVYRPKVTDSEVEEDDGSETPTA